MGKQGTHSSQFRHIFMMQEMFIYQGRPECMEPHNVIHVLFGDKQASLEMSYAMVLKKKKGFLLS
jgi:hypothetical protein